MRAVQKKFFRLKSSVAIVQMGDALEFFNSNVRTSILVEFQSESIVDIIHSFDGYTNLYSIASKFPSVDIDELVSLSNFLNEEKIIIEVDSDYPDDMVESYPRLVNFSESLFIKTSQVISGINNLKNKNVLIIGLGAVGSWIAHSLAVVGLKSLYVIDDDVVEISNLHRQDLFFEDDIGLYKVDAANINLMKDYGTKIHGIKKKIQSIDDFNSLEFVPDIVINCADYPSVDVTSQIVSDYCLPRKIPHIIGGGYNLHVTLVGQVIIPGYSACYHCFDSELNNNSNKDLNGVKKLHRKERKIGSLGAVCSLSASISSIDILKLLLGASYDDITCVGKRLEFDLFNMDFSDIFVRRDDNCLYCK